MANAAGPLYPGRVQFRIRWLFWIFGGLLLWRSGTSIFATPEHEVHYALQRGFHTCVPSTCVTMLTLEVGNTGEEEQADVRVRLRAAPLRDLQMPLKVLNFGKVERPVEIEEIDGELVYHLGRLEPQKRVELQATFLRQPSEPPASWDDVFVAVEPASGEAQVGSAGGVQFARWMNALFGWL